MSKTNNQIEQYFAEKRPVTRALKSNKEFLAIGASALALFGLGKAALGSNEQAIPITERPHKEYTMKKSSERLWNIAQRAYPDMDPRESTYGISQDQPEGFNAGAMHVGDVVYLESDAEIGKPVNPDSADSK